MSRKFIIHSSLDQIRRELRELYLVQVVLIGVALVSSILSTAVDLTLVAGLRRKTVVVLLTFDELAWESCSGHTVAAQKIR